MKNELVEDFDNPPAHFLVSSESVVEEPASSIKYALITFSLVLMVIVVVLGKIIVSRR